MLKFFQYAMLMWMFVVNTVMAECLDVYGVDAQESRLLLKEYSAQLIGLLGPLYAGVRTHGDGFFSSSAAKKWKKDQQIVTEKIKREHHYAYVQLETIFYDKNEQCTTLEVVKSNQQDRRRYLQTTQKISYVKTSDIIDVMREYLLTGRALFFANEIHDTHADCPVYHCTMGFSHPKLQPYLEKFNTAAVQQRRLIIETLNHDPNPERRASAAYLVGHFQDAEDIVRVLMPHVNDTDEEVRNNVMRVLSLTIHQAKMTALSPAPFVHLLSSPFPTDRNKSLFLLSTLAQSKATQGYLIKHAKSALLNILRLQQPNQHDFAYMILKEISHKDFGPHDEARWARWFDEQQNLKGQAS